MRELVLFPIEEAMPPGGDVLAHMGMASPSDVSARTAALLASATEEFARLAAPRGLAEGLSAEEFATVYAGEGLNSHQTPLARIWPQADSLALFAATLGAPVSARIAELFAAGDMGAGYVLDALASVSADLLTDRLAVRFRERAAGERPAVLGYSPGYCGWHISGQRRLFERLRPEEIGITLNDSCLMQPLKSVSGVLVAGRGPIHRFRPEFSFCEACATRQCLPRMRSVR
ncbi:MAG: vitamin B12 dependent-methionine synthase activation domain-containing protein [Rhodospirillaceae bacterium]